MSQAVYDLTRRVGPIIARGAGRSIGIHQSRLSYDVDLFEDALKSGKLEQAVELYGGCFAINLGEAGTSDFERWIDAERTRLSRLGQSALYRFLQDSETAANWGAVCLAGQKLTQISPISEEAHRAVMRALWFQGDGASAIRHYRDNEDFLHRELPGGIGEETRALFKSICNEPTPTAFVRSEIQTSPRLVGRDAEFRIIQNAIGDDAESSATVVCVGDPGIGKSRMLAELVRSMATKVLYTLESRCHQTEVDHSYSAVLDGLRQLFSQGTERHDPSVTDYRLVSGIIGNDPTPGPPVQHRRLFEEVGTLIDSVRADRPFLWFVDDVQWIDRASAGLLHFLVRHRRSRGFQLVLFGRPADSTNDRLGGTANSIIPSGTPTRRLRLGPLAEESICTLLSHARPEAKGHPVVELAARLASGNPSYALELLKAAVDAEGWAQRAVDWDPLAEDSVRRVLAARLSGLETEEVQLLQALAVLGRHARPSLVAHLLTSNLRSVADASVELYRRDLIADNDSIICFVNETMREFVVSEMSAPQAAAMHLAAGQALVGLGDVAPGVLATHFFRGDDWPRCFGFAMEAATQAQTTGGHAEAARMAEIAETVAQGRDERRVALQTRADSLFALGDAAAAGACLSRVLSTVPPNGAAERIALLLRLAAAHVEACYWRQAAQVLTRVRSGSQSITDRCARFKLQSEWVLLALKLSLQSRELAPTDFIEPVLETLQDGLLEVADAAPETALSMCEAIAVHQILMGSGKAALQRLAEAGTYARTVGPSEELRYLALSGLVRTRLAHWDKAEADFMRGQRVAVKIGDRVAKVRFSNNLACVALGRGEWDVAESRLNNARKTHLNATGETDVSIPLALNSANLLFYKGLLADAQSAYRVAETICRQQESGEYLPEILSCRGLLALQRGSLSDALLLWEEVSDCLQNSQSFGLQERFKIEWFKGAMGLRKSNQPDLLAAAAEEESRDVPCSLKLLVLDALLLRRGNERIADLRKELHAKQMRWFIPFAQRWYRMSVLH